MSPLIRFDEGSNDKSIKVLIIIAPPIKRYDRIICLEIKGDLLLLIKWLLVTIYLYKCFIYIIRMSSEQNCRLEQ